MSTYYAIICDDHKEITDAASRSAGGIGHLDNSDTTLLPFIVIHCDCNVRIINEHEREWYDDEYKEWTEDNCKEMREMSRIKGKQNGK